MKMRSLGHKSWTGPRRCRRRPLVRSRGRLSTQAAMLCLPGRLPVRIRSSTVGMTQLRQLPLRQLTEAVLRSLLRRASGHRCFRKRPLALMRCSFFVSSNVVLCVCAPVVPRELFVLCMCMLALVAAPAISWVSSCAALAAVVPVVLKLFSVFAPLFAVVSSICVLFFVCVFSRLPRLSFVRRLSTSRSGSRCRSRGRINLGWRLAPRRMTAKYPSRIRGMGAKKAISSAFVGVCFVLARWQCAPSVGCCSSVRGR